jgi:hypothetical protein
MLLKKELLIKIILLASIFIVFFSAFQDARALSSFSELKNLSFWTHTPVNNFTRLNTFLKSEIQQGHSVSIVCNYKRKEDFHIDSFYFMFPDILSYYKNSSKQEEIISNAKKDDIILLCDNKPIVEETFTLEKFENFNLYRKQ